MVVRFRLLTIGMSEKYWHFYFAQSLTKPKSNAELCFFLCQEGKARVLLSMIFYNSTKTDDTKPRPRPTNTKSMTKSKTKPKLKGGHDKKLGQISRQTPKPMPFHRPP